ncbi:MAG TPA: signal peptidase I [Bryobacteraceae bacterium]|nr:signal peptidase I [Bryobacteraceae bacterium]
MERNPFVRTPKVTKTSQTQRHGVAEWTITAILLLFGTTTLCQAFVIPTGSMEDTLLVGDHVLVDKLAYAPPGVIGGRLLPYAEPKYRDIIVFRYPPDISQTLVKRLIGVPGDRIRITNGVVYRNGARLNEPYAYHKYRYDPALDSFPWPCCRPVKEESARAAQQEMLRQATPDGEIVVPPNYYFAMGDNRDNSSDSRYWGFIPRENIIGKPLLIYWSYPASTEELTGQSAGATLAHLIDLSQHFFTKTRWDRTFRLVSTR